MVSLPGPTLHPSHRVRHFSLILSAFVMLAAAAAIAAPRSIERRVDLGNGALLLIKTIEIRADSIVLDVAIANPGDAALRLNRARSLVLDDGAGGIHHLNPPPDNPELEISPGLQLAGELVFIGPPAPAARALSVSNGAFRSELPLGGIGAGDPARQAGRADGTSVRMGRVRSAGGRCLVSLLAANGSDRTVVLNQGSGLVLTDAQRNAAAVEPPPDNRELVVPAGSRLDAELSFDCRTLDTSSRLTLTGGGQGDAAPAFTIEAAVVPSADAALPASSRAAVQPIAWSMLLETAAAATASPALPARPAAAVSPDSDKIADLTAALHARKTERGLRLRLASAPLFGAGAALAPKADHTLGRLVDLIAATGMREVVVTVHAATDGREQARAIAAWLERHAPPPAPHVIATAKGAPRPEPASAADNPPAAEPRAWVDVVLRRDYLVPNRRSPASPSPGKM